MPPTAPRLLRRLPAWLALLALCVRLALPGLHDHGPGSPPHLDRAHAAAAPRGDAEPDAGTRRLLAAEDHGECAVCAFELATPGGAVPVPVLLPQLARVHDRPGSPAAAPRAPPRLLHQPARAPPAAAAWSSTCVAGAPVS